VDDHRFDALTRSLRASPTRRAVPKLAAALFAGAALSRIGVQDAAGARCKRVKVRCQRKKDQCCKGLICGRKSTDHRCTNHIPNRNCCIPPGGKCKFEECECCGNYQCDNGKCKRR
jgi:hypothetical protein